MSIPDPEIELHLIIKVLRNATDRRMMVCSSADRVQIVRAILAAGYARNPYGSQAS